ncbi:MAG: type II toxin-antitoxin system Phd/YefM family antitoxin [Spirochaetaceae bacterium]|nr:type II toxin-antitoxin system Phd/YefM family antitoxin [Spirochaetaceae bacterium]MDE0445584.1 type II toxin-antitoxin system Phd/YefM family antitoxin [Spirochaetaceae bacterium]
MVTTVNIHEAKTHLSRLLKRVAVGEQIVIARAGTPIARLTPYQEQGRARVAGRDRGLFTVPDDFNAPLPDEAIESFYQ